MNSWISTKISHKSPGQQICRHLCEGREQERISSKSNHASTESKIIRVEIVSAGIRSGENQYSNPTFYTSVETGWLIARFYHWVGTFYSLSLNWIELAPHISRYFPFLRYIRPLGAPLRILLFDGLVSRTDGAVVFSSQVRQREMLQIEILFLP